MAQRTIPVARFRAQQRKRPRVVDLDGNEYALAPISTVPPGGLREGVVWVWVLLAHEGVQPRPLDSDGVTIFGESTPHEATVVTVLDMLVPRRHRVGVARLELDVIWWPRFA